MPNPINLPRLEALLAAANRTGLYAEADSENEEIAVIDDRGVCLAVFSWLSDARVYVALHNAAPALLAELAAYRRAEADDIKDSMTRMAMLRTALGTRDVHGETEGIARLIEERDKLRARVAELETERDGLAFELGKYSRVADNPALYQTINDCLRTDSLAAERDRLRAELADRDAEIAGLRESARKVLDVPASYDDFGNMIVSAEDRNSFITALSDSLSRTPDQHRARIEARVLRQLAEKLRKQDCSDEAARTYEWLESEAERLEKEAGNVAPHD